MQFESSKCRWDTSIMCISGELVPCRKLLFLSLFALSKKKFYTIYAFSIFSQVSGWPSGVIYGLDSICDAPRDDCFCIVFLYSYHHLMA